MASANKPNKNIVILISGSGSNMAAIARAADKEGWRGRWGVQVAAVISNRADAPGLELAQEPGHRHRRGAAQGL
jgi:phosphoribosylglycinamide formyltransferase-1